jgi:hypothetical protein
VDTFFVRGNMKIDDIEIVDIAKKNFVSKKVPSCNIEIPKLDNSKKRSSFDRYDRVPPVITLNGIPSISIHLGETYVEQGATAIDNSDGKVSVSISEEVDEDRVGTYTLFYMAKDRIGNTSMTTRVVNVGEVSPNHKQPKERHQKREIKKETETKIDLDLDFSEEEENYQEFEL